MNTKQRLKDANVRLDYLTDLALVTSLEHLPDSLNGLLDDDPNAVAKALEQIGMPPVPDGADKHLIEEYISDFAENCTVGLLAVAETPVLKFSDSTTFSYSWGRYRPKVVTGRDTEELVRRAIEYGLRVREEYRAESEHRLSGEDWVEELAEDIELLGHRINPEHLHWLRDVSNRPSPMRAIDFGLWYVRAGTAAAYKYGRTLGGIGCMPLLRERFEAGDTPEEAARGDLG